MLTCTTRSARTQHSHTHVHAHMYTHTHALARWHTRTHTAHCRSSCDCFVAAARAGTPAVARAASRAGTPGSSGMKSCCRMNHNFGQEFEIRRIRTLTPGSSPAGEVKSQGVVGLEWEAKAQSEGSRPRMPLEPAGAALWTGSRVETGSGRTRSPR